MINLKKILSVLLIVSVVSGSNLLKASAEGWRGYIDYALVDDELLKVSKNEANYIDVKGIGQNGNEERLCFNFRALDEVFEDKKIISVSDLKKKYNELKEVCEAPFFNKKTGFIIGLNGLIGTIVGYLLKVLNKKAQPVSQPTNIKNGVFWNCKNSLATCLLSLFSVCKYGLILSSLPFIGLFIKDKKNKDKICQQKEDILHELVKIIDQNERNANMLNLLLAALEEPKVWSTTDTFYFYDMGDDSFHWDTKYAEIEYTPEELQAFPEKFREIASKIRKNLEENGKLSSINKNTNKTCQNCEQIAD